MNIELLKEKMNQVPSFRELLEDLSKRQRARRTINYRRMKRVFLDKNINMSRELFETMCAALQESGVGHASSNKNDVIFTWTKDMASVASQVLGISPHTKVVNLSREGKLRPSVSSPKKESQVEFPKIKVSSGLLDSLVKSYRPHDIVKIRKHDIEIEMNLATITPDGCKAIGKLLSHIGVS